LATLSQGNNFLVEGRHNTAVVEMFTRAVPNWF